MRSAIPVGLSALLLVGLGAGSVVAQDSPDRIDLPDGWRPEGVTVLDGTLYAGSLGDGAIWAIDPTTASATGQLFARAHVIRNSAGTITALRLDEALETATLIAELTHEDLDTPTTAALIGDDLWAINPRFGAPAVADTEYWITRLDSVTGAEG